MNAKQIVGCLDLAGRMAGHGQLQLIDRDPMSIIDDPDGVDTTVFQGDLDVSRSGVHRIFQQLLDDAGRTFDHLAGGNLVDDAGRELPYGSCLDLRHVRLRLVGLLPFQKCMSEPRGAVASPPHATTVHVARIRPGVAIAAVQHSRWRLWRFILTAIRTLSTCGTDFVR